jgi:hypothetical protein
MRGFLWFLVMMNVIALCKGFYKNGGFDVLLEFKLLSNPYYNIGMSFIAYPEEDHVEEEFTIGLFFVNLVIVFYKPYE